MTLRPVSRPDPHCTAPRGDYHCTAKGRILGGIGRAQGQGALDGPMPQRGSRPPLTPNQAPISVVPVARPTVIAA